MPDAARKWLEENEKLAKMAPFQIVPPIETVRRLLAECERLKEELDEGNEYYRRVVDSECAPDEIHCTCVPALRYKIDTLEAQCERQAEYIGHLESDAQKLNKAWGHYEAQKLALVAYVRAIDETFFHPEKEWQALGAELREELMTHRHEWITDDYDREGYHFVCKHCGELLEHGPDWIARRLNATEHLSVTSATAACLTARGAGDWVSEKDLLAYARALEESDA